MQKNHMFPACLALVCSLSIGSVLAEETSALVQDRTQTIGPTGMPGTIRQGGSADPTGENLAPSHVSGIPAERFVNEASAKSYALIEMSELALDQGSSEVQQFARRVVDQQRAINQQLRSLAEASELDVAEDANLVDQGRTMVLQLRDGESFDQAYADNLAGIARELVDLFESASASNHGELSEYASATLPQLKSQRDAAVQMDTASGE